MRVVYLAHPCGDPALVRHLQNLDRAKRWFKWAIDQGVAVVADWILYCEVWDDFDGIDRELGLRHDDAMILKCDAMWLVGGRVSEGMARGARTALEAGIPVADYTGLGDEPPPKKES